MPQLYFVGALHENILLVHISIVSDMFLFSFEVAIVHRSIIIKPW